MRLKQLTLAALAAVSLVAATVAAPMSADARDRDRGARSHHNDRAVHMNRDRGRHHATNRDRGRHHAGNRHVDKRVVKKRVITRRVIHDHDGFVGFSTSLYAPYVVLGSPVAYASYGAGYCRALHRGRHWSPGLGWHAGRHVGRVRC